MLDKQKTKACQKMLSNNCLLDLKAKYWVSFNGWITGFLSSAADSSEQWGVYCDISCLPSPWETGSLVFLEGGDAVSDCRFLWSVVTLPIPRDHVTDGGRRGDSNALLVTLNAA